MGKVFQAEDKKGKFFSHKNKKKDSYDIWKGFLDVFSGLDCRKVFSKDGKTDPCIE